MKTYEEIIKAAEELERNIDSYNSAISEAYIKNFNFSRLSRMKKRRDKACHILETLKWVIA